MKLPRTLTIPRAPDFIIGKPSAPYLRRWWVIPRNRWFNIYLHHILHDDDDRALHDHMYVNMSLIISGCYKEHLMDGSWKLRRAWIPVFRKATTAHRLELVKDRWKWRGIGKRRHLELQRVVPCWSLFITGPRVREWGFLCPNGWVHWRDFVGVKTGDARGDEIGQGCNDN